MTTAPMNVRKFYEGNTPAPLSATVPGSNCILASRLLPTRNLCPSTTGNDAVKKKTDGMDVIFRKAPIGSPTPVARYDAI